LCTTNARMLPRCLGMILPDDPPIVLFLNKVYEGMKRKIDLTRANQQRVLLLLAATPRAIEFGKAAGVPAYFMPYAASSEFGRFAGAATKLLCPNARACPDGNSYRWDIGFSGGWSKLQARYPFRWLIWSAKSNVSNELKARGLRINQPGFLPTTNYIETLARTKVWFATSESGDHVSTRYFEVLISGRCMLLCDRNIVATSPLGIEEGVHAAMFNSTGDFIEKLAYYASAEHEAERLTIVANARALVLARHLWSHRSAALGARIREELVQWRRRRAVQSPAADR